MGNNTLSLLAGSETWTEAMAKQFKKMGHEVTVYSPSLGFIAMQLEAAGIHCVDSLQLKNGIAPFDFTLKQDLDMHFDVAICNHHDITKAIRKAYPYLPIIATIHGIIHQGENGEIFPEHPAVDARVSAFVAVSEEVQDVLMMQYKLDSFLLRNGIDLERFSFKKRNEKPKVFLINSNYMTLEMPEFAIIKEVAVHYGAELRAIGSGFNQDGTYNVEKILEDVDIVFAMGRSLVEGMARGCLGICHGRWGTGGIVHSENWSDISHYNYSGRNSQGRLYSAEEMIEQIEKFYSDASSLDAITEVIKYNHDLVLKAQDYIDLAKLFV